MSSVELSSLSRLGSDLYKGVLDFVYPPYCLTCLAEVDEYLCAECAEKIDLIKPPFCRKCGTPWHEGQPGAAPALWAPHLSLLPCTPVREDLR